MMGTVWAIRQFLFLTRILIFFDFFPKNFLFLNSFYYLYSVRKIILFTLLTAGCWFSFAVYAASSAGKHTPDWQLELFTGINSSINSSQKDIEETAAASFSSPGLEVRTANRPGKYNFGILLNSTPFMKSFPMKLEFGNLLAGGGLSRLNSPELSAGTSPFSNGLISANPLTVNLPGYSSFSKAQSSFCQITLNHPQKKPHFMLFNLWVSPENDSTVFSTLLSGKFFSKQLTLNTAVTAGRFYYRENKSNSWFLPSPYYPANSHFSSLFQMSADYRQKGGQAAASLTFTSALYESPFGPFTAIYRADTKAAFNNKEVYASFFLNPYEDVLTSSGKKLKPSFQIKSGINSKKAMLLKNSQLLLIKPAMNVYSSIGLMSSEHPLRINEGLQLTTPLTSLSFSLSEAALILCDVQKASPSQLEFTGYSFKLKNSWYLKRLTPALAFSLEKKEPDTLKYKYQFNLSNNEKQKISGTCAFSFSSRDGAIDNKKLSTTLNCRLYFRQFTVLGKLAFQTDL